jgi:DNA polymerase V
MLVGIPVHFNIKGKYYSNFKTIDFPIATDNSLEIVKTALIALDYIFKEEFRYQKSGIILSGLSNAENNENLFYSVKENKIKNLMKSIDYTNNKYGRSTLSLADAGFRKKSNLRREYSSKIDTADFYCLPTVRAI